MTYWLDEIDLDPSDPSVRMGVRTLGDKPWLLQDEEEESELELKASLTRDTFSEVFLSTPESETAGLEVCSLITSTGRQLIPDLKDLHPLERAGLSIQEDLCLMRREEDRWILAAASLCFPSRWRLSEKIGREMSDVHGPVKGYSEFLRKKVNSLMDRLSTTPVWRRNWFIHPDPSLYQPDRPENGDPIIKSHLVLDELYLRSERQTLRSLSTSGWILFTIRVQQVPLRKLVEARKEDLVKWLATVSSDGILQKGIQLEQKEEILLSLN
tara:strand:+ start:1207 stop:2013 length:807 start_codon:yes stop_codon:yes gene_type:complete